jgi:hypothetical protein
MNIVTEFLAVIGNAEYATIFGDDQIQSEQSWMARQNVVPDKTAVLVKRV